MPRKEPDPDSAFHPDFPVVEGNVSLDDWSLTLPGKFNERDEEGEKVYWRVGMTVFVSQFRNENADTLETRLAWLRGVMSDQAYDVEETRDDDSIRFSYRLDEQRPTGTLYATYEFHLVATGHLQMAVYTDDANERRTGFQPVHHQAQQ